jgi:PAS domain S-box-containing protein
MVPSDAARVIHQALLGDAFERAAAIGAFVLDEHGRYVAVNEHACELSGYERDEIVGLEIGTFNPHLAAEYAAALEEGKLAGDTTLTRKDGTQVDVSFRASSTRVSGLPFLLVVCWER